MCHQDKLIAISGINRVLDSRQHTGVDRLIMILIPRQYLQCSHHGRAIARVHTVPLMNIEWRQD